MATYHQQPNQSSAAYDNMKRTRASGADRLMVGREMRLRFFGIRQGDVMCAELTATPFKLTGLVRRTLYCSLSGVDIVLGRSESRCAAHIAMDW